MSTLSVQTITDVRSMDFSNTEFAGAYNASNAAFNSANLSYNAQNVVFAVANASYASVNSNWTVTNTVYGVANAAFASANNVAPQVTPAFNTANVAFNTANAAFASANNVGPQLAPAFNTANAAFGRANTALQNTNVTLAGNLSISGNLDLSLSTAAIKIPVGTTAQRPVGASGLTRMNTTTGFPEWYDTVTSTWISIDKSTTLLSGTWTTMSDRNPGGTWTDHLASSSFTVPTGRSAIVIAVGAVHGAYESGNGQGAGRIQVRGPSTITGAECWWHRGQFSNYAGTGTIGHTVVVGAGTWTVYMQIVTINGTFIANYYTAQDYLTATAIQLL